MSDRRQRGGSHRPVELLPYALVRVAGGALEDFQSLELVRTEAALDEAHRLEDALAGLAEALSSELYAAVGAAAEDSLRHDLLELRRTLFNRRQPEGRQVELAVSVLSAEVAERLRAFVTGLSRLDALYEEAARIHEIECVESAEKLRELAREPGLRRGLAVSSPGLLAAADRYLLAPAGTARTARVRRTELGLIKYLSRFYCKTSPLSTLTSVAMVALAGARGGSTGLGLVGPAASRVRLNNALCAYFKDRLAKLPAVRRRLPVRPAPGCRRQGDFITLVANVRNVDLFQRVRRAPAVDAVFDAVSTTYSGASWRELVEGLERDLDLEGRREALLGLLDSLVRCGLLEVALRTPSLEPDWEVRLSRELEELAGRDDAGDPAVSAVAELLSRLHEARKAFASADAARRREILTESAARTGRVQDLLEEATAPSVDGTPRAGQVAAPSLTGGVEAARPDLAPEVLLYEDHLLAAEVEGDPDELGEVARALRDLCAVVRETDPFPSSLRSLERRFATRFGRGPAPLLDVCEQLQRSSGREGAAPPPAEVERRPRPWRWTTLLDRLEAARGHAEELALSLDDVREAAAEAGVPAGDRGEGRSDGAFVQLLPPAGPQGRLRAVVNFWCPGNGKMLGRFLAPGEPAVEALREDNRRRAGDRIFAEIRDGSSHASNVHPPLMPYELLAPGGEGRLELDRRIHAADLELESVDGEGLVLRHAPTGRVVVPFDLDFQVERLRSRTFRLLSALSPVDELPLPPLVGGLQVAIRDRLGREGVTALPRLVLEDRLVVARRAWVVRRRELPVPQASEDEWSWFRRIDEWRRRNGLPERVFVCLLRNLDRSPPEPADAEGLHEDDRKPQYVSFTNPFLVRLLGRLFQRARREVVIEEVLPAHGNLVPVGGDGRVTEWVLQWTA